MTRHAPRPPQAFVEFSNRFPKLAQAWDLIHEAGKDGPLDEKTCRLVRLAIAIGARQEGAVHSSVRKGVAMGIAAAEFEHVVALAAGTLGMPATVAAMCQVRDVLGAPAARGRASRGGRRTRAKAPTARS